MNESNNDKFICIDKLKSEKFDNNIYDEFDFNQFGQHINGSHYDENDYDYYGFKRIEIQDFLTSFRRFLNLNLQLNVYSVVKFNENLDEYLEENNIYLDEIIIDSLNQQKKLKKKYYPVIKEIYLVDIAKISNRQKDIDSQSI